MQSRVCDYCQCLLPTDISLLGRSFRADLFSFIQEGKRTISFMSQAMGVMADLDLGTEHLRWMGDARFVYGIIRGCEMLSA